MKELKADNRLRRLLEAGFFPAEMPPPFVSLDLGKFRRSVWKAWQKSNTKPDAFWSSGEVLSIAKHSAARRHLTIVNPVSYFVLAKEIADQWITIRRHLKRSTISVFRPFFDIDGERALFPLDFAELSDRRHEMLSTHGNYIQTDISRYYQSIYTHSIAWALHGKDFCKKNLRQKSYKNLLGARLDKFVQNGQSGQTNGIPIGPDTSRIIDEIVASGIDIELQNYDYGKNERAFRYVDDLCIAFDSDDERTKILGRVGRAFSDFELDINSEKTVSFSSGSNDDALWPDELRRHRISGLPKQQKTDIGAFFRIAFRFAGLYPHDNVLNFALKIARSFRIQSQNWSLFESYLYRCARANSTAIPTVVEILINYNHRGFTVSHAKAKKLIIDGLQICVPNGHAHEVAWLLFLAKGLTVSLDTSSIQHVTELESGSIGLLCLDLKARGLIGANFSIKKWEAAMKVEGLAGRLWLLLYEGSLKGWLDTKWVAMVKADKFFGPLLARRISFYDERKNVRRLETIRRLELRKVRLRPMVHQANVYFTRM